MEWSAADRRLGVDRPITRRNFLDGVALGVGALAVNGGPDMVQAQAAVANPEGQTGLQGQTDAGRMVMHAVRDGSYWRQAGEPVPSGESYDLVVVGAGISGLTAAHQYRLQAGTDVKILILDPLEDFGGHDKRNEFVASNGARLIGYCGMQSMQTPSYFSPAVNQVLADIGIEPTRFETYFDQTWAEDRGLTGATFFASEHWGVDKLVIQGDDTAAWLAQTPLNDRAKADLIALIGAPADYMPGLTPAAKLEKLAQITYKEFLLGYVKVDPQLVHYFQKTRPAPISAPGLTRPRRWMRAPTIIPALRGWIWAKQI